MFVLIKVLSDVLESDISDIVSDGNLLWEQLKDGTLLVTGATGLIGGILVRVFAAANVKYNLKMHIITHGRNEDKLKILSDECGVQTIAGDIRKPISTEKLPSSIDYIIHCAAITSSADMLAKPVDVLITSIEGTTNMLNITKESNCKSFVYLSSMEVYGQTDLREVVEADLGYLDLSSPRSSYPESKRVCEVLCTAYAAQYGVPVKIARLARTFGAGTPNDMNDMRVANQFARKALAGENIELHTTGSSISNCCYTADAIRGILTVLFKGQTGEAYNIANPDASMTIREMAELVADSVCEGTVKVIVKVPEDLQTRGYAPDVGYSINADKVKALGWKPKYGLEDMYKRMLTDWRTS
jgi:nucleoside-diphosphate-sugar epimerase